MKPYSRDFRQKIIEVWQKEKVSIRKLAQRFQVAKSFIQKLIKQFKETGDIRPLPQGGSPPRKLNSEHLVTLVEIMEENNDATLEELSGLLDEATGVKVGKTTMGRISQQLNYSVKKNVVRLRERNGRSATKKSRVLESSQGNKARELSFYR